MHQKVRLLYHSMGNCHTFLSRSLRTSHLVQQITLGRALEGALGRFLFAQRDAQCLLV
jgi:hypothetical protein